MHFIKMHGASNDYIFFDCLDKVLEETLPQDLPALSVLLSDRHTGIGGDGIVIMQRGEKAPFKMRIFNADGSEAQMCGNAIRCMGKYLYERGFTDQEEFGIETVGGARTVWLNINEGKVGSVRISMGPPKFRPEEIPVLTEGDDAMDIKIAAAGDVYSFTCLSMGNPHAVTFVESMPDVAKVGPLIENYSLFPERINVHFVQVIDEEHVKMRVWERGSGITMACGTGACAVAVAAAVNGYTGRKVEVDLPGGKLLIDWDEKTGEVYMTGPAEYSFEGDWIG